MPHCPNCNYLLVLLEKRRKYKCAKCGKLWNQKDIESKEFREWNKTERKESRRKWKKEANQNYEAKKCIPKLIKELKDPKPKKKDQYCEENRETLAKKSREWRKRLSGQQKKEQNEKRKALRQANIEGTRLQSRINYWRQQQKALALVQYEFAYDRACTHQIQSILPTMLLSDLL